MNHKESKQVGQIGFLYRRIPLAIKSPIVPLSHLAFKVFWSKDLILMDFRIRPIDSPNEVLKVSTRFISSVPLFRPGDWIQIFLTFITREGRTAKESKAKDSAFWAVNSNSSLKNQSQRRIPIFHSSSSLRLKLVKLWVESVNVLIFLSFMGS